jgi:hypothetical protein
VVRYAADEVEAYHALKHIESKAVRERKERRKLEKRHSIATPKLNLSRAIKRVFALPN